MEQQEKKHYYCDKCNYTCIHKSHWEQHITTKKHKNNGVQTRSDKILEPKCKSCSFETNNSANMLVHVLTKHSTPERRKKEFKFYCPVCDFGTFTQILFTRHLETKKHISNYKVDNVES